MKLQNKIEKSKILTSLEKLNNPLDNTGTSNGENFVKEGDSKNAEKEKKKKIKEKDTAGKFSLLDSKTY